jgi:ankyrin repeat protein
LQLLKNALIINTNLISGETYLTTGIKLGNSDFAEFRIENGGPVIIDKKNQHQETPLHLALLNKRVKLVTLLIDKGASFKFSTDNLLTFLNELEEKDKNQLLDVILDKTNKNNLKNKDRASLIFESLKRSEFNIFEKLIRNFTELWEGNENPENTEKEKFGF